MVPQKHIVRNGNLYSAKWIWTGIPNEYIMKKMDSHEITVTLSLL